MISKIFKSKYFNMVYLLALFVLVGVWKYLESYSESLNIIYGFAETREIEINMDHELEVIRINVVPGQYVKANELLVEVRNLGTNLNIKSKLSEIKVLEAKEQQWIDEQKLKISKLESERNVKLNSLDLEIKRANSEFEYRKSLWKGLGNNAQQDKDNYNPLLLEANRLEQEYASEKSAFDMEIKEIKSLIANRNSPYRREIEEIKDEVEYYMKKSERYNIMAPHDGLVGNVHCQEGEFIDSFQPIISFYEPNPLQVRAYLSENNLLEVSLGDSALVRAINNNTQPIGGKIIGFGSRIVEIPQRMRKIPDIKTYGRELVIEIPKSHLIQNEKVIVTLIHK